MIPSRPTRRLSVVAITACLGIALGGCAMHDRPDAYPRGAQSTTQPDNVSTPAMQPDRQMDRPRSFGDPGPMYPETGR